VSERREPIGSTHREYERQLAARGERVLRLDYLKQPLLDDAASGFGIAASGFGIAASGFGIAASGFDLGQHLGTIEYRR
jgi:hypothetical protein